MTKQKFTLFWRDGSRNVIEGSDIANAMNCSGFGAGSLRALDFYASGDNQEYSWNGAARNWVKHLSEEQQ